MTPDGEPRRYGCWAGNPKGRAEDLARCIESVMGGGRGFSSYISAQCSRNRGHGPNGEYCKQHAKRHAPSPQDIKND